MISCEGLGNGGVQAVMMGIVRNLSDEFLFDMLLFTSEKRFYDDEFLSYGGKIHRLPRYEGKNRLRKRVDYYVRGRNVYRNVLKLLKNNSYDIIHCNDEFESAVIAKAAYEAGIENRIVHTHIISEKSNMIAAVINSKRRKQISRYATIRVGCSYESCRSFFSRHDRAFIVNNFYDDRKFYFKERDKEESTIFRILQIGSFSDIKNQMFSLEIINRIRREYPEAVLTFVGYSMDQYENKIYKKTDQYGLKNNVEFYPGDADTLTLLSRTDAFLLPSLYEGQPLTVFEARALHLPVILSDFSSVEGSLLENGQYLVHMDADSIYKGMLAYLCGKIENTYVFHDDTYNKEAYEEFKQALFMN